MRQQEAPEVSSNNQSHCHYGDHKDLSSIYPFMTIIERKQLAAHQRRVGPNYVGYFGVLQPFSDALKLIVKETIVPSQSNKILFYLSPVSTLIFSLLG